MGAEVSSLLSPQQSEQLKKKWGEDIDGILSYASTCFRKLLSVGAGGNLSRKELEKGLGLLSGEPNFVKHVFEVLDLEKNGKIDFYEYLTFLLVMTRGTVEDKLYLGYRFLSFLQLNDPADNHDSSAETQDPNNLCSIKAPTNECISLLIKSYTFIFRELGFDEEFITRFMGNLYNLLELDSNGGQSLSPGGYQKIFQKNERLLENFGKKIPGKTVFIGSDRWNFALSIMTGFQLSIQKLEKEKEKESNTTPATLVSLLPTVPFSTSFKSLLSPSTASFTPFTSASPSAPSSPRLASLTPKDFTSKSQFLINSSRDRKSEWNDYAPRVFHNIRLLSGISNGEFLASLGVAQVFHNILFGHLTTLSELSSEGKSGSFFYFSHDGRFMVKTISAGEKKTLIKMLPSFYEYLQANPFSLLTRYYGVYLYKVDNYTKHRFVIMGNIFGDKPIHHRYDLKGSTIGRSVGEGERDKPGVVLKDLDFLSLEKKINVGPRLASKLTEQIKNDVAFLQANRIIDYSLLVGIHNTGRDPITERNVWVNNRLESLQSVYKNLRANSLGNFDLLDFNQFCYYAYKHSSSGMGSFEAAPQKPKLTGNTLVYKQASNKSGSHIIERTRSGQPLDKANHGRERGGVLTKRNHSTKVDQLISHSETKLATPSPPSRSSSTPEPEVAIVLSIPPLPTPLPSPSSNVPSPHPSSSVSPPTSPTRSPGPSPRSTLPSTSLISSSSSSSSNGDGPDFRVSRRKAKIGRESMGILEDDSNPYRKENGGMLSYTLDNEGNEMIGEDIIYVGIIDTLITFAEFKQSEHFVRSNMEGKDISVVPPDQYGRRFVKFISQAIV